jgi:hypothetical protein
LARTAGRARSLARLQVIISEASPNDCRLASLLSLGSGAWRCGLKRHRSARILAAGHAFVQNLRRGHYDIATDIPDRHRLRKAFDDLAITI